ncbi:MAG TPA: hypothetical protein VMT11_12455 [Myxococcaceae bacterium]|nr:hypothetical protein [Myxococcaceae bacterium]
MLFSLAVAAMVLASPPPLVVASQLPKGAVLLIVGLAESADAAPRPPPSAPVESPPGAFLGGLLGQLAVVKPHRSGHDAPPSLQMFLLIAPMKGRVGVHAIGSF